MATNGENGRFVPSGVDAQSWLGFEQRVQERRFRALLDTMNHALAEGDGIEVRVALEEARELRPAAPELAEIEDRLAALPTLAPPLSSRALLRTRTIGAVMMLLTGITLLTGIEWMRTPAPANTSTPAITSPELRIAAPVTPVAEPPVTIVSPPPTHEIAEPDPIGTSGLERAIRSQGPVVLPQPTFRQASTQRIPSGEIPDDFVFRPAPPRPRQLVSGETPDDFVFQPPAGRGQLAGSRQPALSMSRQATPGAASAFVRREPTDQTRVRSVLNQYARAYGQLDAGAAREVWPSVNEGALARAFAGLASQNVAFDDCQIDVRGVTANASCRGRTSFIGKAGNGEPRTESRTWRFELRRDGDAWKIENAEARRQ
jgi:hypothetical protein